VRTSEEGVEQLEDTERGGQAGGVADHGGPARPGGGVEPAVEPFDVQSLPDPEGGHRQPQRLIGAPVT